MTIAAAVQKQMADRTSIPLEPIGNLLGVPAFICMDEALSSPAMAVGYGIEAGQVQAAIVLGPHFEKFSESDQKVILYHERGHIARFNSSSFSRDLVGSVGEEIHADKYAAIYLGKQAVIGALSATRAIAAENGKPVSDLDTRIAALA